MNNQKVFQKYGTIAIRTDKPYHFGGEQVVGTIVIDVISPDYPGNSVMLKLKGVEELNWKEEHEVSDDEETVIERFQNRRLIMQKKWVIHNFESLSLKPGQYEFPFSFFLKPDWPGTYFDKSPEYQASIAYKITAKIPSTKRDIRTLKIKRLIAFRQQTQQQMGVITGDMTMNIKQCGCRDQGVIHMKCTFDRNCYAPGEMANIEIEFNNSRCSATISQVDISLIKILTLESNYQCRTKVFKQKIGSQRAQFILVVKGKNVIKLKFPISVKTQGSTTYCQIFSCQYKAQVQLIVDGIFNCQNCPIVCIPLEIRDRIQLPPQIQQPQNWSPQIFDVQLVQFDQSTGPLPQQFKEMNNTNMQTECIQQNLRSINQQVPKMQNGNDSFQN